MLTNLNKYKVKLTDARGGRRITFEATPTISESRSVEYQTLNPIHMPGSILAYSTTPARTFGLSNVRFIGHNTAEITKNMRDLQTLRAWCMPRFGSRSGGAIQQDPKVPVINQQSGGTSQFDFKSAAASAAAALESGKAKDVIGNAFGANFGGTFISGMIDKSIGLTAEKTFNVASGATATIMDNWGKAKNKMDMDAVKQKYEQELSSVRKHNSSIMDSQLGMPPPVLFFTAYSDESGKGIQNIKKIPVVITSLGISYPDDVDYIPSESGVPFPTIMTVDISLTETHSPREYENFSLNDFYNGILEGF